MSKKIYITNRDMEWLRQFIFVARIMGNKEEKYLALLEGELDRALVVQSTDIPPDVITMNTQVRLRDLKTKETTVYRLVFPDEADMEEGKLSVLAPIGTALLGCRVGEIVEWTVPAGTVIFKIEEIIYQPEASGRYEI